MPLLGTVPQLPTPSGRAEIRARAEKVELRPQAEFSAAAAPQEASANTNATWWSAEFHALGSTCEIFFHWARDPAEAPRIARKCLFWLAEFEADYSRFTPDSITTRINQAAGNSEWISLDETGETLLNICHHAWDLSKGSFDATSLPLSRLWHWKNQPTTLPTEAAISTAKSKVAWQRVERRPRQVRLPEAGMELDLGGVGKEFAVDALIYLLQSQGVEHGLVDLGRDIRVLGTPPEGGSGWTVGLEAPEIKEADADCHGAVLLRGGVAVATSGDYRRCFVHNNTRYGHIIDCQTGRPVAHQTSAVTVVATSCVAAGAAATAAMVKGGAAALDLVEHLPNMEALLWENGKKRLTRGFKLQPLPPNWAA